MTIRTLAELSAKLVELESHPGREHLRRYPPTGATAQRWAIIDAMLGRLWDDLADQTDDFEQADAAYPAITELLDTVDTINTAVAKQLAPLLTQIDAAGAPDTEGRHRSAGGVGIGSAVVDSGRYRPAYRLHLGTRCFHGELA